MTALLLLLLSVPAGAEHIPPPTDLKKVPLTFLEELIIKRKVSNVTMRIYNTGVIHTKGGGVSSMKSWAAKVRLDVPVFLIEHPKEGLILFDAGVSTEIAERMNPRKFSLQRFFMRFESASGQDVIAQMKVGGLDAAAVRWVIVSHLHLDHAGLIDRFPGATIVISKPEWEHQKKVVEEKKSSKEFDPGLYEARIKLKLVDLSTAPAFGAFDHAIDLFSDGTLFVVALPGHTPGSIGLWANLDGGPVLMTGDASWVVDNHMDLALPYSKSYHDLSQYWRSLHIIRAMQEAAPRLVVFPGHDLVPRTLTGRQDLPLAVFPPK